MRVIDEIAEAITRDPSIQRVVISKEEEQVILEEIRADMRKNIEEQTRSVVNNIKILGRPLEVRA
jgi:hypothetical protein